MFKRVFWLTIVLVVGWGMIEPVSATDLHGSGRSVVDGDEFILRVCRY
jgi:hypothetical protein